MAPELGIRGAAIGTMISRCLEFLIVFIYVIKIDKKLKLFSDKAVFHIDKLLRSDYVKVAVPVFISGMLWAISVPMQTAILGHLSPDAIAANSVASTFYQYMKVVVLAMSSASSVMMGKAVGKGDLDEVKAAARTLSVLDGGIGMILGLSSLFHKRFPFGTVYIKSDSNSTYRTAHYHYGNSYGWYGIPDACWFWNHPWCRGYKVFTLCQYDQYLGHCTSTVSLRCFLVEMADSCGSDLPAV